MNSHNFMGKYQENCDKGESCERILRNPFRTASVISASVEEDNNKFILVMIN